MNITKGKKEGVVIRKGNRVSLIRWFGKSDSEFVFNVDVKFHLTTEEGSSYSATRTSTRVGEDGSGVIRKTISARRRRTIQRREGSSVFLSGETKGN